MYFAFEGIDGCGKTTQAKMFASHLIERGVSVYKTREPGQVVYDGAGNMIADLRKMAFRKENSATTTLLCFALDRAIHHCEKVGPQVEAGNVVVSDRGLASMFAYQVHGEGIGTRTFNYLMNEVVPLMPTLTFWIDLDLDEAKHRADKSDHPWSGKEEFYEKVLEGYKDVYQYQKLGSRPFPTVRIDGSGSVEDVHKRILNTLQDRAFLAKGKA